MNVQDMLIIALASVVGLLYLLKIRSYDIYEKEPLLKLMIVTAFGGFISIFTSLFLYEFVHVEYNWFDAIFKIGLIEEVSKYLALVILFRFIGRDFNEIVDGIIYMTAIALGFATIENIFYAFKFDGPFLILFQRSIYPVLGHISFSGYMGIAFYIHKKVHKNHGGIILSIVIAAVAHGFYDGVLFHQASPFVFHALFIGLILLQLHLLKTALGFSAFRKVLKKELFVENDKTVKAHCSHCEKLYENKELKFWRIEGSSCSHCGNLVLDHHNTLHLLHYYRPLLNRKKYLKGFKSDNYLYFDKDEKIIYNPKLRNACASFTDLGKWLRAANREERVKALSGIFPGRFLSEIGLKYLLDHS